MLKEFTENKSMIAYFGMIYNRSTDLNITIGYMMNKHKEPLLLWWAKLLFAPVWLESYLFVNANVNKFVCITNMQQPYDNVTQLQPLDELTQVCLLNQNCGTIFLLSIFYFPNNNQNIILYSDKYTHVAGLHCPFCPCLFCTLGETVIWGQKTQQ